MENNSRNVTPQESGKAINGLIITGAGGFLGSHLSERFLKQGKTVIAVDNFSTGMRENVKFLSQLKAEGKFVFVEADVSEPWTNWLGAIDTDIQKKVTHVLHFASPASPPHYQRLGLETIKVNSVGTMNAIAAANQLKARMVFASTSEVYGDPSVSPQPENYWGNVNSFGERACYDESKRLGEAIIFTENKKWNTDHGMVRIFNTYGPRMNPNDGRVIINFLIQAFQGVPLTAYGNGSQSRSFCYVDDLCDAIERYAQTDLKIPVNIGNPFEFTILELIEEIKKLPGLAGVTYEFKSLPHDDPRQRNPDLTRAKQHLGGWQPKIQLQEGLQKTLEWVKNR